LAARDQQRGNTDLRSATSVQQIVEAQEFSLLPPEEVPAFARDYPGMLTLDDKQLYYQCARDLYRFEGGIVDLGTFVGATTSALIYGMLNNPHFQFRRSADCTIHVYDRFSCDWDIMLDGLNWMYPGQYKKGDNFLPAFRDALGPLLAFLEIHQGDILESEYRDATGIECLGVDICKSREITDKVFRTFLPRLIPGAYVIQQDMIHPWHPYLHTAIGYFADRFQLIHENPCGASVLYRLVRPIEERDLPEFSEVCLHDRGQWLPLWERAFAQLRTPRARASMQAAKVLLVGEVHGPARAKGQAEEAATFPLSELDKDWISEVLAYVHTAFHRDEQIPHIASPF
jgi:hypothetical protein